MNVNVKTALAVGQAKGVLILAASDLEAAPCEYSPLQIKQAVTGLRARQQDPGAGDDQGDPRSASASRSPTTPPTRWPSPSRHTHHNSGVAARCACRRGGGDDRLGPRQARVVDGERAVIEVGGLGLEVLASGAHLARSRRQARRGGQPVHVPPRARGRAAALRLPRRRGSAPSSCGSSASAAWAQGGAGRALGLSGRGARARRGARRRQEVREHPRHRQEARPAAHRRAQGQGGRELPPVPPATPAPAPPAPTDRSSQARSALQNLGLTLREAEEALRGAPEERAARGAGASYALDARARAPR